MSEGPRGPRNPVIIRHAPRGINPFNRQGGAS